MTKCKPNSKCFLLVSLHNTFVNFSTLGKLINKPGKQSERGDSTWPFIQWGLDT